VSAARAEAERERAEAVAQKDIAKDLQAKAEAKAAKLEAQTGGKVIDVLK